MSETASTQNMNPWTKEKENDFLSYVAGLSRKAEEPILPEALIAHFDSWNKEIDEEKTNYGFEKVLELKIEAASFLPLTKAKMLMATGTPITENFKEKLKGERINVECDNGKIKKIEQIPETKEEKKRRGKKSVKQESSGKKRLNRNQNQTEPNNSTLQVHESNSEQKSEQSEKWSDAEINDFFSYLAELSRMKKTFLTMTDEYSDYKKISGTKRSLTSLEAYFQQTLSFNIENMNYPIYTRAVTLFATKTPASEQFLDELRNHSFVVDISYKITKYVRRLYTNRSGVRTKISPRGKYSAKFENEMIVFLIEETSNQPLTLSNFWEEFHKKFYADGKNNDEDPRTAHAIDLYFTKHLCSCIHKLSGDKYDLNTKARMLIACSAEIDKPFLDILRKHAKANDIDFGVSVDLKTLPEKVEPDADEADVKKKSSVEADANAIPHEENTWTEVEDNDFLGYIADRSRAGEILNMENDIREYKKISGTERSEGELTTRFDFLKTRIEGAPFLHFTRAKMLFATGTPASYDFKETLKKRNIIIDANGARQIKEEEPENENIEGILAAAVGNITIEAGKQEVKKEEE